MESNSKTMVTVETSINASIAKVWQFWVEPNHITNWAFASEDWCCPKAENDIVFGGKFSTRMEAKDGSFGFDFSGTYTLVEKHKQINYTMDDGRICLISFTDNGETTHILQMFEAETENPIEMQQGGWQAILNNFKSYTESN